MTLDESTALAKYSTLDLVPIKTPEQYVAVAEHLKTVALYEKKVEGWFRGTADRPGPLTKAYSTYKDLLEKEKEALAPAATDRAKVKGLLVAYDDEQARIAAEEQRRLEEIARKDAEDRRIAEAAALEREASQEQDESLRDVLLAEAQGIFDAPTEVVTVSVQKATPKVSGVTLRDNWKARQTVKVKVLAKEVGMGKQEENFLLPNYSALDAAAKASKGTRKIPGVEFYNDRSPAARR